MAAKSKRRKRPEADSPALAAAKEALKSVDVYVIWTVMTSPHWIYYLKGGPFYAIVHGAEYKSPQGDKVEGIHGLYAAFRTAKAYKEEREG
jgi:hypothetical protein